MTALPHMPFDVSGVLDIAPMLRQLQAEAPIVRVRTQAGDEGWLVTRHEEVRELFSDSRLGRSHPEPQRAARATNSVFVDRASDNYGTEDAEHAAMRALFVPAFSARRMLAVRPHIASTVDRLLTAMERGTPPVDLHEAVAARLPVLVVCALVGVPEEDRATLCAWTDGVADTVNGERSATSWQELLAYLRWLLERKRREPTDDVISELVAAWTGPSDEPLAGAFASLLFAGLETTAVRIDYGTVLLLTNPEHREAIMRDESLIPSTVEEILRRTVIGSGGGLPRYARADIEIGGVTIKAGEAVLLCLTGANTDERVFVEPETFDIMRQPNPHIAFGYGSRYCVGASLARIELQVVFTALFRRFPNLRLAVPFEELRLRTDRYGSGVLEVPVSW
jgi:cytochrome P450